jgi:dTDP-glucose 4,6-dehydratase
VPKILVIGCNSFSGSSFCKHLLNLGNEVIGTSRSKNTSEVFLPHKWERLDGAFKFFQINLNSDLVELEKMLSAEKPTLVFNFAAQSMVGESWDRPEDWMKTNVVAVSKLAEILRRMTFLEKYIHVTTPEVYGSTSGWIDERENFNPSTPYAVSRAAGDMLFKIYHDSYGLPVVFTRAANVYGPGQQLYRIIPRTIMAVLANKPMSLHGGGSSSRSFIHIDDVCNATWMIAKNGALGESYHISTNETVTIKNLVETLCNNLNASFDELVDLAPERLGKDDAYFLKSDKIRKELGWTDKISLSEGLVDTISWAETNLDQLLHQPLIYRHKP